MGVSNLLFIGDSPVIKELVDLFNDKIQAIELLVSLATKKPYQLKLRSSTAFQMPRKQLSSKTFTLLSRPTYIIARTKQRSPRICSTKPYFVPIYSWKHRAFRWKY